MNAAATKPATYPAGGYRTKVTTFNENHSTTSVVDYDLDGYMDVILAGSATSNATGPTTVYYWNIQQNFVKSFKVVDPTCNTASPPANFDTECTWQRGVGTINVADIDGDGDLECTFASAENLYAMENDFSLKWVNTATFQEGSSGFTGTSVFDFDGDGSSEIIYRDELRLYVIDGSNGNELGTFSQPCESQTQAEYPIVVDVDNDGETDIVCSCRGKDNNDSHIAVFKAGVNQYWVPARSVWNQKSYFNVNINDNLTVPRFQQPHHLNFAQICNDPTFPKSFALNKFLNQSPRISYCGRLVFPSPRLDFGNAPTVDPPVCPDNQFKVTLHFTNTGDEAVNKPIPIAFYEGDPRNEYLNTEPNPWLDTVYVDVPGGLQVGQTLDTTLTVTGARGAHTLYISLNDIGPFDKITKPTSY